MENIYKEKLRSFLNYAVPISDEEWNLFDQRLVITKFHKGDLILMAGDTEKYIYFLLEGVSRIFYLKDDTEYTLRFNFPISVFNSYTSYISQSPSLVSVEALTDIVCFKMSYTKMQSLYEESKIAERIGRKMIEMLYVQRELKEIQIHTKTAEDFYREMLEKNRDLIQHIPQKYIASYLGITPESLSRIRKKIAEN